MNKVIFLFYIPLTLKLEKNHYFQDLLHEKIRFEYWDISNISYKNSPREDTIERDYVKKINSLRELKKLLKEETAQNSVFLPLFPYELKVAGIFRVLSKFNCSMVFLARGALPSFGSNGDTPEKGYFSRLPEKIRRVLKEGISHRLKIYFLLFKTYLYKKLNLLKPYDVIFVAGTEGIRTVGGNYLISGETRFININHFDHDNYLAVKDSPERIINNRYCVFLDSYLPYHPEFKLFNVETIAPESYFKSLNTFFKEIENKYDLEVVIAAHPISDYTNNPFAGRKIFTFKTNELVRDCEFVIAQMSTAISYAVLYNKKLLLIYTDEIEQNGYIYKWTKNFSQAFGVNLFNIDRENTPSAIQEINTEAYNDYKYKYLTSKESETRLTKQVFIGYLKNYNYGT
jgi:hypothetical protein